MHGAQIPDEFGGPERIMGSQQVGCPQMPGSDFNAEGAENTEKKLGTLICAKLC